MQESLYERFRPFKPYDLVLAVTMLVLVAGSIQGTWGQRLLLLVIGVTLFVVLDFVQRVVRVPAPLWQSLGIIALNTIVVTWLIYLRGRSEFTLAFLMLNVGFATVAFGEVIGVATALLSVLTRMGLTWATGELAQQPTETGLTLAVLLALVAILVRVNRMQQDALFDAVTGLRNHRYFQVRLRDELKRSERSAVSTALIILDLDDFKKFNDLFGHAVGDQVLRQVAELLQRNARAADVVCRYGGEEIAVILPETGLSDAVRVAERLRQAVEVMTASRNRRVTISAGVACYPDHARQSNELIRAADQAMYRAKRAGKNCVKPFERTTHLPKTPNPQGMTTT
jgi:diguanylate cyclase (GGDEF)-like protein